MNTIKYNETTDCLDVYLNDQLIGSLPCHFYEYVLYDNGIIYVDGGFEKNTLGSNIPSNMSPYITENSGYILFGASNSSNMYSGGATLNTVNPIYLTKYEKLSVTLSYLGTQAVDLLVNKEKGSSNYERILHIKSTSISASPGTFTLDISGLTGEYYIGISIGVALSTNQSIYITKIELH